MIQLRLYVIGEAGSSERARRNLGALLEGLDDGAYDLEIIDVLSAVGRADEDRVLATPVLLKRAPAPSCRIVGDLGDLDRVAELIGLRDAAGGWKPGR